METEYIYAEDACSISNVKNQMNMQIFWYYLLVCIIVYTKYFSTHVLCSERLAKQSENFSFVRTFQWKTEKYY